VDRRIVGAVLLVGALVVVVVTAGLNRSVAGVATAVPVRPAPQVGDCLLGEVSSDTFRVLELDQRVPSPPLGPCTGPRTHEVVAVEPNSIAGGQISVGDRSALDTRCLAAAGAYLGWDEQGPQQPGDWYPIAAFSAVLVGPDARQRASGQRWAACLVHGSWPSAGALTWSGTAQGAWRRSGEAVAPFTACWDVPEGEPVSCLSRHREELFASMATTVDTTERGLLESCRELVVAATGMADPTRDGALTVEATIHGGGFGGDSYAQCAVAPSDPDRRLTSTLRNLGSGPLPLDR
jgi:hypothetical protein